MKSKLHRATVTGANLNCEGGVALDEALIGGGTGFLVGQAVQVLLTNRERFETYELPARRRSSELRLHLAAARLVQPGD